MQRIAVNIETYRVLQYKTATSHIEEPDAMPNGDRFQRVIVLFLCIRDTCGLRF